MATIAATMEQYIRDHHKDEIERILKSGKCTITIIFNLTTLFDEHEKYFKQMRHYFDEEHAKWKLAVLKITQEIIQVENIELSRENIAVEIEYHNHPHQTDWPKVHTDIHQLVQFKGMSWLCA